MSGGSASQSTAQPIGGASWRDVGAGLFTTCAVRADHTLMCWGMNGGNGLDAINSTTQATVTIPAQVGSATTWGAAALSADAGCALHLDGTLACWGNDSRGEYGDDLAFFEAPQPLN